MDLNKDSEVHGTSISISSEIDSLQIPEQTMEERPLTFAEITAMIQSGQTHLIPNNKQIPGGVNVSIPLHVICFSPVVDVLILIELNPRRVKHRNPRHTCARSLGKLDLWLSLYILIQIIRIFEFYVMIQVKYTPNVLSSVVHVSVRKEITVP